VGHHLFQRNIRTIEQVKDLEYNYPSEPMVRECGQAVVNFSSAAIDASKSGQVDEAHQLTEVADAVYQLASFSVHAARGFAEGTADCVTGLAHMLAHPIKTTEALSAAGEKVARFLWHSGIITLIDDPSNEQARKAFDETMQSAKSTAVQLYDRWCQLPLEEKGHFAGEVLSFFFGPGAISKGAKLLGAMPKAQAGIAALGRMANAEANRLGVFARNTLLGVSLATKVENAQLVTFGGKLMTSELAQALAFVHAKIGGTLPVKDFVSFVERSQTPITYCFKRTFREFERIASAHTDPRKESLFKIPQLIEETRFKQVVKLLKENEIIKQIGGEIYVHGSRAKGTAKIYSDIDIGIRVSAERFEQLIQECFPNAANSRLRTMGRAIEVGKIQRGELKLSKLGKQIHKLLGIKVDISVIKAGGPFDYGPFISI
jgi:predicted nucleotidyltransferase